VETFRNSATAAADAISPASVEIRVTSPQFRDSARVYRYRLGDTSTLSPSHNNPFVETVLLQTLTRALICFSTLSFSVSRSAQL
jgi:hypothetical protein